MPDLQLSFIKNEQFLNRFSSRLHLSQMLSQMGWIWAAFLVHTDNSIVFGYLKIHFFGLKYISEINLTSKLFYINNTVCFSVILTAIHKYEQQLFYLYFYINWTISNTVRPFTDVNVCKDSVKYPSWRFFIWKNLLWKSTLDFFFCQIHSTKCFVFYLAVTVLLFLKKSKYLWFSSEQVEGAECIIFC